MDRQSTDRRTLLKLAGSTAVAASVAGCSGLSPFSGGTPQYRDWVPAGSESDGRSSFAYMDTSARNFDRDEFVESSGLEAEPDALAGFVLLYAGYANTKLTIGSGAGVLRNAALTSLLPDGVRSEEEDDDQTDSSEQDGDQADSEQGDGNQTDAEEETPENSTIDGVLVTGKALVLFGDIDVDELRSIVSSRYEEVEERDGYTVFERSQGDVRGQFAAGDDALVLPIGVDSEEIVGTMLDTVAGDGERFYDQDDMSWAMDEAGSGQFVYGSRDPGAAAEDTEGFDFDLKSWFESALPWDFQEAATGVVSSTRYNDGAIESETALTYEAEEDVPDEGEIQNQVTPTSADDYDVSVDGTRVEITGTWEAVTDADGGNSSN